MGLLKDWADRWLHHRTTETGTLPVSADNENQRMSAVATDEGVLLFSDSVKGMKARSTYLQHLADGFFNFSKKVETLKLYEIEIPMRQMVKLADNCIDKLSKADLRRDDIQLRKSVCSFTPEKMSGKEMLVGAVCTGKYDLRPDFNNFDRLTKDFGLGISPRNYDVAALLYISENGYAGLMDADHFHPFSCQYEFKELAEKRGDSMKARREAPLSAHDFGYAALQMEAKTMARDILQSEFHITGGEFRLGGKANRTSQRAKTPEKCLSQQSKEPEPEKPGHQAAKHVSSIVPQKKEKKTTDYIICLWKRE